MIWFSSKYFLHTSHIWSSQSGSLIYETLSASCVLVLDVGQQNKTSTYEMLWSFWSALHLAQKCCRVVQRRSRSERPGFESPLNRHMILDKLANLCFIVSIKVAPSNGVVSVHIKWDDAWKAQAQSLANSRVSIQTINQSVNQSIKQPVVGTGNTIFPLGWVS